MGMEIYNYGIKLLVKVVNIYFKNMKKYVKCHFDICWFLFNFYIFIAINYIL